MKFIIKSPITKLEFISYYKLRWEILRKKFDNSIESAKDELENHSYHVMAVSKDINEVIGVGRMHQIDDETIQIRFMGVKSSCRGFGVGTALLLHLIQIAKTKKKNKKIVLHSRENSVLFYKNNGFKKIRKSHNLFNKIQHYYMIKNISN